MRFTVNLAGALFLGAACGWTTGPEACAAYTASFSTTGSAADFAPFQANATDDDTGADSTDFTVVGGGDPFFRVQASPPVGGSGGGAGQLRYQVAPSLVEGAEVAIPTGMSGEVPRTEARLTVRIREIIGGDDLPIENPFTQFGFAEFDPVSNTPDYASKIIVQIDRSFNAGTTASPNVITLSQTTDNAGAGNVVLGAFNYPGSSFMPNDTFELQVTNDQARLLLNGAPLQTAGPGTDYKSLPADFFANNFDAGDVLIPFFGVIRGPSLEDEDVISAGFDDINARNVMLGGGVAGDANGDGEVTFADVVLIASKFREAVPQGTMGDLDANALVDFADFRIWKTASGSPMSIAEAFAAAGIPEPSGLALAGIAGLAGLGRARRRRPA